MIGSRSAERVQFTMNFLEKDSTFAEKALTFLRKRSKLRAAKGSKSQNSKR